MTITGRTRFYALLADPIEHVKTPELHNQLFANRGLDVVVVPVHVSASDLDAAVSFMRRWRNLVGVGVTIPHKEAMSEQVDDLSELATLCGATNVVRRDADGGLRGTQLDGPGMVWSLRQAGHEVTGRAALIIGAGGTAKGVAFELAASGLARLTLTNRTVSRAEDLAATLSDRFPSCDVDVQASPAEHYDIVINATSIGMTPENRIPVPSALLTPGTVVADVVMTPAETPLLRAASAAGCAVHPGLRMLRAQFDATVEYLGLEGERTHG